MVGHEILDLGIMVRVHARQLNNFVLNAGATVLSLLPSKLSFIKFSLIKLNLPLTSSLQVHSLDYP